MPDPSVATRTRVLEAAAAVFAEHGYAAATVRMICSRAEVNVAAVNYHFGNKEELYREVLRYARRRAHEQYPVRQGLPADAPAEERLRAFVRSFLLRTLSDADNLGWGKLLMRELVDPTSALDMMVEEGIRALSAELMEIVGMLLGETDPEPVAAASRGVISQCLFYLFSRPVISRMAPQLEMDAKGIDQITEEILSFSLHALKGLSKKGEGAARP